MLAEDEMSRKVSLLCMYCSRFNNFYYENYQGLNMIEFCQKKIQNKILRCYFYFTYLFHVESTKDRTELFAAAT